MQNKIIAVTINKSLIGLGANGPTSKKTSRARSLINNIVITAAIVYNGFFINWIYNVIRKQFKICLKYL